MASGVGVHSDCVKAFNDIKLGHKHRYCVFSITQDLKEICVHSRGNPGATYDDFVEELMAAESKKECRYGVYDAEFELGCGQRRSKLVFFTWSPDTASVKQKMIYSSSKDALKKALNFNAKDFQANDPGDLAWTNLMERLLQNEVAA